jgi:hypothetical protein
LTLFGKRAFNLKTTKEDFMPTFFKELFTQCIITALTTWWGQTITASTVSVFGVWLANKTPTLVEYAPFSYLICFLLVFLIVLLLFKTVQFHFFSGTEERTFIEFELIQGRLERKNGANIYEALANGIGNGVFRIFLVFKRDIKRPIMTISDKIGLDIGIMNSFPYPRFLVLDITATGSSGRFCIDCNGKDNS